MIKVFLVTPPGVETYTFEEVKKLQDQGVFLKSLSKDEPEFETDLSGLYQINLRLRTINRVLVRLGQFYATGFPELVKKASRLPWAQYLSGNASIKFRTTCKKSKLYHSGAVNERILTAIQNQLGAGVRVSKGNSDETIDENETLVIVRFFQDECTVSIDSSGSMLHRRGYRKDTAKAPLRENLAAAMLLASGWQYGEPLLDPFCGSGTIPIEAALMAANIPPGLFRQFAFMHWQNFDKQLWNDIYSTSNKDNNSQKQFLITGSDRNTGAIQSAIANSKRANVINGITWVHQAISSINPGGISGWIITNPPYGVRIQSNRDLRNLYAQFGNVLKEKCPGWQVLFLCNDPALAGHIRLPIEPKMKFQNGSIQVTAYYTRVPA